MEWVSYEAKVGRPKGRSGFSWIALTILLVANMVHGQSNTPVYAITQPSAWVDISDLEIAPSAPPGNQDEDQRILLINRQIHVGKSEHYRRIVKAFLNESGVQDGAKLSISFDPSYQQLDLHYARVWRNGHAIDKLKPTEIKVLQQEKELSWHLYNGSVSLLQFLEDIRVGDILDYAYTIKGQNPIFDGKYIESLDVGYGTPINQIQHRLLWPEKRQLNIKKFLTSLEAVQSKIDGLIEYRWNIDASRPIAYEDSLPLSYNPYPWIQFSEFADWKEVADWAEKLYSLPKTTTSEIAALAASWKSSNPAGEDPILTAIRFVQDDVRYLGIEIGANSHQPTPPETVLARRFGDCKDKALLLCALLRELGAEAYPALVNTTDRENIKDQLASPYAFNHVVVQLKHKGKVWWVDATSSGQRGKLSSRYFPDYGYALIIKSGAKALELINPDKHGWPKTTVTEKLILRGKKETADFTVSTRTEGSDADYLRDRLKSIRREEIEKDYLNFYAQSYPGISQAKPLEFVDDQTNNILILTEYYRVENIWEYREKEQDYYWEYYPQDLAQLLDAPQTRLRTMPLDINHPVHHVHRIEVQLPEAWPVKPAHFVLNGHAVSFESRRTYEANKLVMEYEFKSTTNTLPAALTAEHIKQLEEIDTHLGYSLNWGSEEATEENHTASINWTVTILAVLYGGVLIGGFILLNKRMLSVPPPLLDPDMAERYYSLKGIGGWLLLIAFALCAGPIRIAHTVYSNLYVFSPETWSYLTTPSAEGYHALWAPYLILGLLINETIIIWSVANILIFFKKRHFFPKLIIAFLVFNAITMTADYIMATQIEAIKSELSTEDIRDVVRTYISCFIWIPYFLISKRVKLTFVH